VKYHYIYCGNNNITQYLLMFYEQHGANTV